METGRLGELGADLLVALEEFLAGKHGRFDLDSGWREVLDTSMPAEGLGADAVLRLLREQVVPFGSPMSDPGSPGFLTPPGGTVATLAPRAQAGNDGPGHIRTLGSLGRFCVCFVGVAHRW